MERLYISKARHIQTCSCYIFIHKCILFIDIGMGIIYPLFIVCYHRSGAVVVVVVSVPITTNVVGSNPVHYEVYSIQHHVIKFVSYLR